MDPNDLAPGDVLHWPAAPLTAPYYVVLYREAEHVQFAVLGEDRTTNDLIATDHLVLTTRDALRDAAYVGLLFELRP